MPNCTVPNCSHITTLECRINGGGVRMVKVKLRFLAPSAAIARVIWGLEKAPYDIGEGEIGKIENNHLLFQELRKGRLE